MLGHKKCFSKFETTEIILSILPDHKTMKLEVNYKAKKKKNPAKTHKNMKTKQYIPNNHGSLKKPKEK